jgi:2,3-bisphosphoglycerate-dependent phosphoglycerate mutase
LFVANTDFHCPVTDPHRPSLLVLVRHAESARNLAKGANRFFADDEQRKSVRGVPDFETPLTESGRTQARLTGHGLRGAHGRLDYVYRSGYARTRQTAEGILEAYPHSEREAIKVRQHVFLRERDTGYTYDMTTAEAEASFPWLQDYWDTFGSVFARPPGGESLADVVQRVYLFLNMLFRDRSGRRILVVTHGGTIQAFRFLLERWTYEEAARRFREDAVSNCAATTYRYDAAAGRLRLTELCATYSPPEPG